MRSLKQSAPRLADQRHLHEIVHHLEMTGDIRLKRELMQDRFAKCVNSLDFQPTRRFKRTRKKPPCDFQTMFARAPAFKLP